VPGQNSYACINKLTDAYLKLDYQVVKGYGVGIRMESKEDHGTEFIVLLPV